jgi:DNA repair protein RadD
MQLRPYQQKGIEEISAHFRAGLKKVLLWLATGGGKTVCFSHIMIESEKKGWKCMMIVRGRKLVAQASTRLFRENVPHGVIMATHWNFKPTLPIQLCSIDTLIAQNARPFKGQKKVLIVIDEAHMAVSEGYREVLADYPDALIVAVTATPYSNKSLEHIAETIVHPVTVRELMDTGFLVDARYYAPAEPNVSGVRVSKSTGDYVQDELAALMDKSSITGDIIAHWKKIAEGRPTICFAVSVEHSKHVARQFTEAGIPAEHCDADTKEELRDRLIQRLEAGEIKVLVNVGILCTGVDIPSVSCIVMARPTKSYNLYIQQAGRGTRPAPGKKDFIVLDHAGNVTRHGFITDEPEPNLKGRKQVGGGTRVRRCDECFAVVEEFPCPAELLERDPESGQFVSKICGWSPPVQERGEREILHVEGELKEIKAPSEIERYECERFCEEQIQKCLDQGRSVWKAFYKTSEKFGDQAAKMVFFRICKKHGISTERKKKEPEPVKLEGFPFK